MKLFLILVLFICCNTSIVFSQSNCDENKIISTDPNNPENTEKPSKKNGLDKNTAHPHNGAIFNWIGNNVDARGFPLNSSVLINNQVLTSPFFETNNPRTNIFSIQRQFNARIDNLPEDGWELIHQDFGYTDNGIPRGVPPGPGEKAAYPHLILYNRYRGLLRVFVNIGAISGNTTKISVKFIRADEFIQTSLLDLAYATEIKPLNALDDFRGDNSQEKQARLSGWSQYLGNAATWYYADFALMYDPCTCFQPSKLSISVHNINKPIINVIRSIVDGRERANGSESYNSQKNFIQNGNASFSLGEINGKTNTLSPKAIEIRSSVSSFANSTKNLIDEYHSVVPIVSDGMKQEVEKNKEIAKSNLDIIDQSMNYAQGKLHSSTSVFKDFPYIGSAFSSLDYFSSGGSSSNVVSNQQKVSMSPIVMNSIYSVEGEIVYSGDRKELIIWNPGSNIPNLNNVNYQYPYYNHAMGVMNLWKTPRIETHKYYHHTMGPNYGVLYYTKILDDIEYVINPAAGLSLSPSDLDISASLIVDFGTDKLDCNEGPPIDGITFAYPYSEFFHWENERVASTPFIPIGCIKEINPRFYTPCESNNPETQIFPRYYLKILAFLKRNDHNESKQKVIWEGVYKFNEQEYDYTTHTSMLNHFAIPTTIPGIKKDVVLSPITEPNPISSDRSAWRTIKIKSGTVFNKGSNIVIMAGYSIDVDPDVEIPENVELKIGFPFTCTTSVSPKTITLNDCNSQSYMKNRRFEYLDVQKQTSEYTFSSMLEVVPNPAHNSTTVYYHVEKEGFVQLSLNDALGRLIIKLVDKSDHEGGNYQQTIDTSQLPNGVYYCTLFDGTNYRTTSLIVIR